MAAKKKKRKKSTTKLTKTKQGLCQTVIICGRKRRICRYASGKKKGKIKSNKAA